MLIAQTLLHIQIPCNGVRALVVSQVGSKSKLFTRGVKLRSNNFSHYSLQYPDGVLGRQLLHPTLIP